MIRGRAFTLRLKSISFYGSLIGGPMATITYGPSCIRWDWKMSCICISIRTRPACNCECDDPALPTDGRNLVARAAGLVLERAGLSVGLSIRIVKRIPVSAGLGGGSSDAAATIVGLNRLLALGWSASEMARLGQVLGSDVPFFFFCPDGSSTRARRRRGPSTT